MPQNPFAVSAEIDNQRGVYGDATLIRSGFLYRVVDLASPLRCQMIYDGWWFRQRITFDGELAWFQISWLTIRRRAEFRIPYAIDPSRPEGSVEIDFGTGLAIRRFRLWIAGQIVYDEIN